MAILFIRSSFVKRFDQYQRRKFGQLVVKEKRIAMKGYSGGRIEHLVKFFLTNKEKFEAVILQIGSNDLCFHTPMEVYREFVKLISIIPESMAGVKVLLCQVLQRKKTRGVFQLEKFNCHVNWLNIFLENYSTSSCGVEFWKPVNNLVHQMIKDDLQIDILRLHCNVHPLDTIASEVRKCLIKFDNTHNLISSTGNYGTAVSFVYNLSKLNHSNKADPHVFRAFLKEEGVNPGIFLRYVGNRFHIMFHMAGVVIRYSKLLHTFLSKYNKNEVTKALLTFMKLEGVMVQLHALGLLGKFVTGPWMKLVYGNAANRTNLETGPIFQAALDKIKDLTSQPNDMLTMKTDVFGGVLKDDVYTSLMEFNSNKDQLFHLLSSCMGAVSVVMERQMTNYLTGTLSNPTPQMIDNTICAYSQYAFRKSAWHG